MVKSQTGTGLKSMVKLKENTPIEKLVEEYSNEGCDFSDMNWVINSSLRFSKTMPDSLARCLLYTLAFNQFKKNLDND